MLECFCLCDIVIYVLFSPFAQGTDWGARIENACLTLESSSMDEKPKLELWSSCASAVDG